MAEVITGRSFIRTFVLVFLSIAGLFTIDTFLAKTETAESRIEAARLFEQGRHLMQQGQNMQAINPLKGALATERGNADYQLALAQALLAADQIAAAEANLTGMLQTAPTDGAANLVMARVLAKEGKFDEAVSYYHRAIYGHWASDASGNRLQVRFELIDLLVQRGGKGELLAELLPLEDEAPADVATRAHLGQLYLTAGSPSRAAGIFHEILRKQPANGDAYSGLGQAEFAGGNYRAAHADFQTALRLKPDDTSVRERLDLSTQVLDLDPTQRGLSVAEKYRRSVKLVELTLQKAASCAPGQQVLDQANKAIKQLVPISRQADASEENLDLAEQLWQVRKSECKQTPIQASDPLALVFDKLAK